MIRPACLALLLVLPALAGAADKTREEKVREDRQKVEAEGFWIYNDLPRAFAESERTGKPILVVLRCIPCEECVKLDDELVDQDPVIRPLLEQFVCVRQVSTNGLDLDLFQFDTDQSFAVFMLNHDGTIYGRFGTRSHRTEWLGDVSLPGMANALQAALELHADYPANKEALAGKRGAPLEASSPEQFPSLREKYTDRLNYSGDVVRSCIHCHQIGDARRDFYRAAGKPIPDKLLYPYPHPKVVGLTMDPKEKATVKEVQDGSYADQAGLQPGDQIEHMDGQPILSIADVQWVLHTVDPSGGEVALQVSRGGQTRSLALQMPDGWRRDGDLSWRVSSWGLRRMATGGLVLEALDEAERTKRGIEADAMALRVKHVGQFGDHAAAKRAGFHVDDILISYDGRDDLLRESDLLRHGVTKRRPGESVPVVILRGDERRKLTLPMQR